VPVRVGLSQTVPTSKIFYIIYTVCINTGHRYCSAENTCIINHHAVDAVYFDFAKAFDSVGHRKLLHKLTAYGITGDLLNCSTDFFQNRIQRVALPNGVSSFQHVSSGAPQGSVLELLLFLIYINDITDLFPGVDNINTLI